MTYTVKEIFYTLQGEGANTGRAAVFCRFSGCNLWSGRESDRFQAICQFCDTDFMGTNGLRGGKYHTAATLALALRQAWPTTAVPRFVVFTGGEPLLQLDTALIDVLHQENWVIAVETNGTVKAPLGIDWLCVSPKAQAPLVIERGQELKLVYPQPGAEPERYQHLHFQHFFLQALDNSQQAQHLQQALSYCQQHPQWRLSLQTHKLLGIP